MACWTHGCLYGYVVPHYTTEWNKLNLTTRLKGITISYCIKEHPDPEPRVQEVSIGGIYELMLCSCPTSE